MDCFNYPRGHVQLGETMIGTAYTMNGLMIKIVICF